jgi:hypothetical protein
MRNRASLILFLLSVSGLSFSQSVTFGSLSDTVYYTDRPVVYATLYPGEETAGGIFGLRFKLNTSCGYFNKDSVLLRACSGLTYGTSYLSIADIQNGNLLYGISGIVPDFDLGADIDSIHIGLPLSGLSPDDSLLTVSISDLLINDLQGNILEEEGPLKSVLIRKSSNNINNPLFSRLEGLKTSYNSLDGSVSIIIPEEYSFSEYTVKVYDLSGRQLLNRKLFYPEDRITGHNLMSGFYLLDLRYKKGTDHFTMSAKLIIPD